MTVGESKKLKVGDQVFIDDLEGIVQVVEDDHVILYFEPAIFLKVPHSDMGNMTKVKQ
jgi:hypothetical protein